MATIWTPAEQQQVTDEGLRLQRAGKVKSISAAFVLAQSVLPKARRRTISTTAKVPWFVSAIKAAKEATGASQSADQQRIATPTPSAAANASQSESPGRPRNVRWKDGEKDAMCAEAARQLLDLEASSLRDALQKAQLVVLPLERRRHIASMNSISDWYPDGLQKARLALLRKRERETQAAINAKLKEEATAAAPAPVLDVQPTTALATASASPLALFGDWSRIREHLVQEIASLVAEGIHRGLASVQLAAPQTEDATPARHVPFVVDPHPKVRPPSVLVAGLKDATASQIKAEFGSQLDLRFITPDKSKDQLRQMTEQAETTIAVTDFLSHAHTDIIKARARHHIESSGGMTSLRQHLANLAGLRLNGSGAHAG